MQDQQSIGFIGEIDPRVVEFERVPFRVFAFELDLEALEDAFRTPSVYHQLMRQPAVTRDLAIVVRVAVVVCGPGRCDPFDGRAQIGIDPARRPVSRLAGAAWSSEFGVSHAVPRPRAHADGRGSRGSDGSDCGGRERPVWGGAAWVGFVITVARACPCHRGVSSPSL